MTKHTNTVLHQEERVWFFAALVVLLAVLAAYMYFVSASVVHVVMRKEINQDIAEVGSYVSQLESQYIEAQHAVSADIATQDGYVVAASKVFIDRTESTLVLRAGNGG